MTDINNLAMAINVLVGTVIPLVVAVLAKWHAPSAVKSVLNLGLTAVSSVLTAWLVNPTLNWQSVVTNIGVTWALSIATYYGLWKPTTVSTKVLKLNTFAFVGPKKQAAQQS